MFPNDRDVGWFSEVNAAFCALVGWKFLGARARGSIRDAIGNGLTAAVMMLVLALFFQCLAEMLRNSWDKRYDNAPEGDESSNKLTRGENQAITRRADTNRVKLFAKI